MATALVTGGTGFVGAWIARTLLDEGHNVRILRRNSSSLDAIVDLSVEHFVGDLDDIPSLEAAMQGVDWVFHVAAIAAYWRNDKDAIYRVNVDGTRNVFEVARKSNVERVIFTSSAAAVGWREDKFPSDEDTYFNLDPKLSPYAHSKFLAEVEAYRAIERGLDIVILNPSVVIGPGDLNQISGSLVIEIAKENVPFMPMQGGITLIDVRDVAKAHVAAAQRGRTGERYLLGAVNMTHKAFFGVIGQIVNKPLPKTPAPAPLIDIAASLVDIGRQLNIPIPGDAEGGQLRMSKREIFFDCSKAWRELHEPEIDVYESVLDTYTWYQQHGIL